MKIYIKITKHCIDQIKKRNPKYKETIDAKKFGKSIFEEFIYKGEYNGKKVRMCYTKNGKYRITDGEHQFIYAKPYKIEYILITYVKRAVKLSEKLRPKERFIREGS